MSLERALVRLTDLQWSRIQSAPLGVVVLCRTSCGRCDVFQADIERSMQDGGFAGVVLGKLVIDDMTDSRFLVSNSWARSLAEWPTSVIYRHGVEIDRFSADRARLLLDRLDLAREAPRSNELSIPDREESY